MSAVSRKVVDMGLLIQTAEPAKEVLAVERIAVVADRGYFKIEDIGGLREGWDRPLRAASTAWSLSQSGPIPER